MLRQGLRFGLIGVLATAMHLSSAVALIYLGCPPLLANVISFAIAFSLSFVGHISFSFADQTNDRITALQRFSCVAFGAFALNEVLFAILLTQSRITPLPALTVTTGLAAVFTFFLSRNWVFQVNKGGFPFKSSDSR